MVAAWISADTGVGPAMASGSQTYSGICALFPAAPSMKNNVIAVTKPPPYTNVFGAACMMSVKFRDPTAWKSRNIAIMKPTSPMRLTMKAFFPASAFSRSLNQ